MRQYLTDEIATPDNWERLKEWLVIGKFLHFTGTFQICDITEGINDPIPIFIIERDKESRLRTHLTGLTTELPEFDLVNIPPCTTWDIGAGLHTEIQ